VLSSRRPISTQSNSPHGAVSTGDAAQQGVASDEACRSAFGRPLALAAERRYVGRRRVSSVRRTQQRRSGHRSQQDSVGAILTFDATRRGLLRKRASCAPRNRSNLRPASESASSVVSSTGQRAVDLTRLAALPNEDADLARRAWKTGAQRLNVRTGLKRGELWWPTSVPPPSGANWTKAGDRLASDASTASSIHSGGPVDDQLGSGPLPARPSSPRRLTAATDSVALAFQMRRHSQIGARWKNSITDRDRARRAGARHRSKRSDASSQTDGSPPNKALQLTSLSVGHRRPLALALNAGTLARRMWRPFETRICR